MTDIGPGESDRVGDMIVTRLRSDEADCDLVQVGIAVAGEVEMAPIPAAALLAGLTNQIDRWNH